MRTTPLKASKAIEQTLRSLVHVLGQEEVIRRQGLSQGLSTLGALGDVIRTKRALKAAILAYRKALK